MYNHIKSLDLCYQHNTAWNNHVTDVHPEFYVASVVIIQQLAPITAMSTDP